MNSSKNNNIGQTFCIKNPTIQNIKYFTYKDKRYSINFDLLKMNSKYFFENQQKYENIEFIPLLNDIESSLDIPEESIEAFISSCQNEPFQVTKFTVVSLQCLSIKYEYPSLTNITNEFIEKNSDELVFQTLLFKTQIKSSKLNDIDTSNEENIISKDIFKYIKDENMLLLPIPVLYRIFYNHFKDSNNKANRQSQNQQIIEFLFKVIDKYGKDGSILFSNIDFEQQNISVVNRLLKEYSDKFDFNMINSTLLKTTTEITSEMTKQREEFKILFASMSKEIERQKNELKTMQEEQIKQINEIEKRYQKEVNQMKNKIEQITIENKNQMKIIQKQFEQMIEKNNKIVNPDKIKRIDGIVHSIINYNQFKELDEENQKEFIKDIIETSNVSNKNNGKFEQQILFIHNLFKTLNNGHESYDFESEYNFIIENVEKPNLSFIQIQNLYQSKSLNPVIMKLIQNYDDFSIEIQYPSDSFNQISKSFNEIKNSYPNLSNKINISFKIFFNDQNYLTIKLKHQTLNENYLENVVKAFCNKLSGRITTIKRYEFGYCLMLTQLTIPSSVTSIGDCAFYQCSSLAQITIPSSVTSIGSCSFYQCSSLAQITIPSSVTSIGSCSFSQCSSLAQITIPSSVTSIGSCAFSQCSSLAQIMIPSSIGSQGSNIFQYCPLIQDLLPSSFRSNY